MKLEQFIIYNIMSFTFALFTHELGHFLMARLLNYRAKIIVDIS